MKKKNQKLQLSKLTLSKMGMKNIIGGAGGYSYANQVSCGATCFVTSCGCPKSVNGNCKADV